MNELCEDEGCPNAGIDHVCNPERKITNVYSFPNGVLMVFDQFGRQMSEYQGRKDNELLKIRMAGFTGEVLERTWPLGVHGGPHR